MMKCIDILYKSIDFREFLKTWEALIVSSSPYLFEEITRAIVHHFEVSITLYRPHISTLPPESSKKYLKTLAHWLYCKARTGTSHGQRCLILYYMILDKLGYSCDEESRSGLEEMPELYRRSRSNCSNIQSFMVPHRTFDSKRMKRNFDGNESEDSNCRGKRLCF